MNQFNDILLIEYILGNTHGQHNPELIELLKHDKTQLRIKQLTADLEIYQQIRAQKPSTQLRNNILNDISSKGNQTHKFSGFAQRLSQFYQLPLKRMNEILQATNTIESPLWDQKMLAGASLLHFKGGKGLESADCGLIHLTPGNGIGKHIHNGDEFMLVLKGELMCSDNHTYRSGDWVHSPKGSEHSVTVTGNQNCIFAVIADYGVTFIFS